MNEHLDFDTDFLNQTASVKRTDVPSVSPPVKSSKWKPWLIGGGIIIGVFILVAASDSSSTYSSPNTSSNNTYSAPTSPDDVIVGEYRCSSYNANRADALKPDISETAIENESSSLDARITALNSRAERIENMYVDEYDQYSVDNYNSEIDSYNFAKNRLNTDIAAHEARVDRYNNQVETYNNFLETNCSPAY